MKYFIFVFSFLLLISCEHTETPEEAFQRIQDSILFAQDSIVKAEQARLKHIDDSTIAVKLREKTLCPELIPFFEMSERYVALMKNGELGDSLTKKFGLLSDSIIALENKIMDKQYSKMDTTCQLIFIRRMGQKTFDMTDELLKKLHN